MYHSITADRAGRVWMTKLSVWLKTICRAGKIIEYVYCGSAWKCWIFRRFLISFIMSLTNRSEWHNALITDDGSSVNFLICTIIENIDRKAFYSLTAQDFPLSWYCICRRVCSILLLWPQLYSPFFHNKFLIIICSDSVNVIIAFISANR